jgi:ABC-type transport system involved in multi-copper enzyme maturation permease subunit
MFIVFWIFVQRGTLGPLGQSFLKQGLFVYVVMTVLNGVTIGTFFSTYLVQHGLASTSSFAYLLPSALACRLYVWLSASFLSNPNPNILFF